MTTNHESPVLDHSRRCSDCNRVLLCGCQEDQRYPTCDTSCEDWDGDPSNTCTGFQARLADREPDFDNYSGPRGREAEYEQAHRMDQARRLK